MTIAEGVAFAVEDKQPPFDAFGVRGMRSWLILTAMTSG